MSTLRRSITTIFTLLCGVCLCQEDDLNFELTDADKKLLERVPDIPGYQKRKPGEIAFAVVSPASGNTEYFYMRDGVPEKLQINTGSIRRFQHGVFGEEGIIFYQRVAESVNPSGFAAVGRAESAGFGEGIIIFHPKEAAPGKDVPRMPFIDLSKSSFVPGQVRMLNLTPLPLLAKLANTPARIPPLGNLVRTPSSANGLFPLQIAIENEGKTRMIYSNIFQSENDMRVLFLIIPDRGNSNASSPARCLVYKDKGFVAQ